MQAQENWKQKREQIFVCQYVQSNFHNSQKLQTIQVSIDGWKDKQDVIYAYKLNII